MWIPWTQTSSLSTSAFQDCPQTSSLTILMMMITFIQRHSPLSSRLTVLACDPTWVNSFLLRVFEYPPRWCTYSAGMAGATWNCCRPGKVLCTPYNHAPCHFMQSHIHKVYACLPVTCHLHFWQNDRDLLRATAVPREWNGYRSKSQHRKLTLEKKILPPLLQGIRTRDLSITSPAL